MTLQWSEGFTCTCTICAFIFKASDRSACFVNDEKTFHNNYYSLKRVLYLIKDKVHGHVKLECKLQASLDLICGARKQDQVPIAHSIVF